MLILPLFVDVAMRRYPVMNVLLILAIIVAFFSQPPADQLIRSGLVLGGASLTGMLGHVFLHADVIHLLGNMIFLWAFGNAICAKVGNVAYLPIFFVVALLAAIIHLVMDGAPAIGASGAINGIVGMFLILFPRNNVACFWFVIIWGGMFRVSSYWMILLWLAFDLWGVVTGGQSVAYWAHIGGLLGGAAVAVVLLKRGYIEPLRTEETLLDIFAANGPEKR